MSGCAQNSDLALGDPGWEILSPLSESHLGPVTLGEE